MNTPQPAAVACTICGRPGATFVLEGTRERLCADYCAPHAVLVSAWTEGLERRAGRDVVLMPRVPVVEPAE